MRWRDADDSPVCDGNLWVYEKNKTARTIKAPVHTHKTVRLLCRRRGPRRMVCTGQGQKWAILVETTLVSSIDALPWASTMAATLARAFCLAGLA